jgi:hypothetical protein
MAQDKRRAARDVAVVYAPTDDGKGARILRSRDGALEAGEVRPVKNGQPIIRGEVVRLVPRSETPCVCDVEVLHEQPAPEASQDVAPQASQPTGRPAQVATEDYRLNWDRIFGGSSGRRHKRDSSPN